MLAGVKRRSADVSGAVHEEAAKSLSRASSKCTDMTYSEQKKAINKAGLEIYGKDCRIELFSAGCHAHQVREVG